MTKNYFLFKEQIKDIIYNSGLNIGAVYYILKDILRDIEIQYINQVNKELTEKVKTNDDMEKKEESFNQNETNQS